MAPSAPVPTVSRAPAWRSAVALVGLTLVGWGSVPAGSFQFDDRAAALVHAPPGLRIRPLLAMTWAWDQAVHGERAAGWLAENLVLHCLTVLAVLLLGRRLLTPLGAFVGAALFALQPANAEVVAYVSGRSTGLMALLVLGALWAWRPGAPWAAAVLFVAAVMTKEVALVFPALLLLWTRAVDGRPLPRRQATGWAALAAVLGAALAVVPRYRSLAVWSVGERGPLQSLALNVAVLPEQISLWVRPRALSVEHTVALDRPLLPGLLLLVLLVGVAWACRRRLPAVSLVIAWVLVALLPTQSVIAKADVLTEKPLYLAWVAPALLLGGTVAWVLSSLSARPLPRGLMIASLGVLALLATLEVRRRVEVWRTPESLWADAVRKAPRSSRAWNNFATALRGGPLDAALHAARRSVELDPSNGVALANLANLEVLCPHGCSPE